MDGGRADDRAAWKTAFVHIRPRSPSAFVEGRRGTDGWWLPALGASLLALTLGLSSVSLPSADDPGSVGRTWAVLAIAFAIAIAGVTYREARASGA